VIERLRSSKSLSRSKLTNFGHQLSSTIDYFTAVIPILARLATDLLDGRIPNHLHRLFAANQELFRNGLDRLRLHFEMHIGREAPASGTRIQFQHLIKLRALLDEVATALTGAMGPLSVAFSIKLAPIVSEREVFSRSQMSAVAAHGEKMSEIRSEIEKMVEKRKVLETGENNLTRMFGVLVKFMSSLGMEEEEEDFENFV
jgi:hypothetical protein